MSDFFQSLLDQESMLCDQKKQKSDRGAIVAPLSKEKLDRSPVMAVPRFGRSSCGNP